MARLTDGQRITPSFVDVCKKAFLGRPMINDQLQHERLSNPVALGVPGVSAQIVAYDIESRISQATRAAAPPARPDVADSRTDVPESQGAYAK